MSLSLIDQLIFDGYRPGDIEPERYRSGRDTAESLWHCGARMRYECWAKDGNVREFAICRVCGEEQEF